MEDNRKEQFKPYRFSPEELKVIKECGRESFFQRCLPFSAVLGAATYYGVKSGYLKPSPRFGAVPKVVIAGLVGYFLGKISYQSKCAERLMQLPNSQIGQMLRQRKRGNLQESVDTGFGSGLSLAPFGSISSTDVYTDIDSNPSRNFDLDAGVPQINGLDDTYRPSLDNPGYEEEEMPPQQKQVTTYEELRKQNREEYLQKRTGAYKEAPKTASLYQPAPSLSSPNTPTGKNRYGDDME